MTISAESGLLLTIIVMAAGTAATRFLPFLIFPPGKEAPAFVKRLGLLLPGAVSGLLVVYCLREVNVFTGSHGLPELLALAAIMAVHLWKRNTLLSIAAGTVVYMLLVQTVF